MRLINARTLTFEEVEDDITTNLKYGILSHRWGEEEVTYQDAISVGLQHIQKKGIKKIRAVCRLARLSGLHYAWVDTCCIDKSSSAELSEAINSMFRWYQQAYTCFAYLDDIDVDSAPELSLWFSRAWTLQELIAPRNVLFYIKNWQLLGSKAELADNISARTGIPHGVLTNTVNIYSLPVAQRMSWARRRSARRLEDIAYSLLGLFDVNMPLLYGEGRKAFRRLQEEIIKQNNDQTIFLWAARAQDVGKLLAPSPDGFDPSRVFQFKPSRKGKRPFAVTNLGLSISLPLIPWHSKTYLALLDCEVTSSGTRDGWHQPGLYLRRIRDSDLFEKINFSARDYGFLQTLDTSWSRIKDIHIAIDSTAMPRDSTRPLDSASSIYHDKNLDEEHYDLILRSAKVHDERRPLGYISSIYHRAPVDDEELYGFVLRSIGVHHERGVDDIVPQCNISTKHVWDPTDRVLEMVAGTSGDAVIITLPQHPMIPTGIHAIKLGFDFDFYPCCMVGVVHSDCALGACQCKHSVHGVESEKILAAVDLSQEHEWLGLGHDHVIPLSSEGYWLLKGDLLLGLSVLLGPPAIVDQATLEDCFAKRQVSVRLTREPYRGKIAWMFDLRISPCPGMFCSSHEPQGRDVMLSPPEIIVSPPLLSP
ncbi:hypothetical protein LTR24_002352 [Lithohypha guttulata]|uniref:Heterokaryon incompatibility domain-containing protein n=1 Tax=Lithohypha guttulata TaxID=1690604 RepID=A0ABR0KIF6_9EURO|nr:hypothetical protein LTR24_002352 [Lithohypha guttulata]